MLQRSRTSAPLSVVPSTRTLSKSDYMLARTCETKLYFRENHFPDNRADDPYLRLLAEGGYMVEALAKAGFPGGIQLEYGRDLAADLERTMAHLQQDDVTLFEATLVAGRRQARVDILEKRGGTVRLIEVKGKSFDGVAHAANIAEGGTGLLRNKKPPHGIAGPWREKLEDVTYQVLLLERLLPDVTIEPCLILVDKSKQTQLDNVPGFFELIESESGNAQSRLHTATYTGSSAELPLLDLLVLVDVREEVDLLKTEVEEAAALFEARLDAPLSEYESGRGAKCAKCEFRHDPPVQPHGFAECWGELANVQPHVLDLYSVGTVKVPGDGDLIDSMFRSGRASLLDVPLDVLVKSSGEIGPRAARQRRQIEYTHRGETFVSPELRSKIDQLQYPLHFIDFEASRLALPYHAGMRPYGQVAFQWSCHTLEHPDAPPVHREWLNAVDYWPNREFAETLRDAIGDDGTVLTWSPFENTTLRGIMAELPARYSDCADLMEWLDLVQGRTVDLAKWAESDFFHPGMRGRTSIKVVLDALWKTDADMRDDCRRWSGFTIEAHEDPYAVLPAIEIAGKVQDVTEGTAAITAYRHMMYGSGRNPEEKEKWARLLRQYCELDTLSMVLIFNHWRRITA